MNLTITSRPLESHSFWSGFMTNPVQWMISALIHSDCTTFTGKVVIKLRHTVSTVSESSLVELSKVICILRSTYQSSLTDWFGRVKCLWVTRITNRNLPWEGRRDLTLSVTNECWRYLFIGFILSPTDRLQGTWAGSAQDQQSKQHLVGNLLVSVVTGDIIINRGIKYETRNYYKVRKSSRPVGFV